MSFGRGDLTNPVSYNGGNYQNSDLGSEDSYNRLINQVSSNIHSISQNVQDIRRLVGMLGTNQDTNELRERLRMKQKDTNQISKETARYLKEAKSLPSSNSVSEQRTRKTQIERLMSNFSDVLNTFQSTQREAASAEKECMDRARAASQSQGDLLINFQPGLEQQQQQATITAEDLQEVQERENTIRQLESDIVDVNMIFKDLATMVHEQGEMVDSIEVNVETAETDVVQGNTQLRQAREHQASARKKKFYCMLLLIVLIVVLIVVIYLSVKGKN